jgi:hypothetical protein
MTTERRLEIEAIIRSTMFPRGGCNAVLELVEEVERLGLENAELNRVAKILILDPMQAAGETKPEAP